ncbi:hypothetical protein [Gordonia aichiensis]|uniref:hypothetical protein n=1 Tax=Gordonia aichiensis TaxID=36820 RepID=UPI0032670D10
MRAQDDDGIGVDLDALARLTATQRVLVDRLGECAAVLTDGGLCDWADAGPAQRAAALTAHRMGDLAARLRTAGVAVDAVAADLARAADSFDTADDAAATAVRAWSQ